MIIYKILRRGEYRELSARGRTSGSPDDIRDGFIHFSTAAQLRDTLSRHFSGEDGLVLLEVDAALLAGDLRWEPSRGGDLFPHLHAELDIRHVRRVRELPDGRDRQVPADVPE